MLGLAGDYDPTAALDWIEKAANTGLAEAQLRLGDLYNIGFQSKPDFKQAYEWWTRAATQADAAAQLRLARAHSKGAGTKEDPIAAYVWASLSALQGNEDAFELRKRILSRLTPEEIEKADRMVESRFKGRANAGGES